MYKKMIDKENINLFETMEPAKARRAVVIVGRFQPPTIGHYKIINLAKKFIRENKHLELFTKPVVVIVDGKKSGLNKKENPLSVEERIYFMKHSTRANGVEFLSASSAYDAFNAVRRAGFEPIVVGAGSDRVQGYLDLLDDKFVDAKGKKQRHYSLHGLDSRQELKPNEESLTKLADESKPQVSQVSGSLARRAAELGYFDEFVKITGLEKNIPAAKKMFNTIKEQIGEK